MLAASEIERIMGPAFADTPESSHAPKGSYYTDTGLYDAEQTAIFGREWVYCGHHSQIPDAGDYLVRSIGDESIFMVRDHDDRIRAFYNVCQHRGHQLLQGKGRIGRTIVCPYHAWCYGLDGKLRGAPKSNNVPNFDASSVKLSEIRTESVGGFLFANMDPNAEGLHEMAPGFREILLAMVPQADDLKYVTQRDYDIQANWKIVTENFLEAYHVEFSGPAHRALGKIIDVDTYGFEVSGRTIEYTAKGGPPDALPYDSNEEIAFHDLKDAPFHQVFLYPNMTFSVFPGTNMLFVFNMVPRGVDRTVEEIVFFTLDGEMSDATKSAEEYLGSKLNHEDVTLVEAVHRGMKSRGFNPGRLMVDGDRKASWSEHFVHHFNRLNVEALRRPL